MALNLVHKLTGDVTSYNWLVEEFGAGYENVRKTQAQRLWDYYVGDKRYLRDYLMQAMRKGGLFKEETLNRMRLPYRNIIPKVIKRTSLAYKVPAYRYLDSESANELYQDVLSQSNINTQAKEWNRLAKLLTTVYVHVVWREDHIEYDLMPPHLLTVKPKQKNYLEPQSVMYIAEVDGEDRLIYWDEAENVILDKEGKKVIDRIPNPYRLVPFVPCRLSSPEDHWGDGDQQLVDIQEEANIILASAMYNAIMQGHGQLVGVNLGIKDDENLVTGPDTIITVEGATSGPNSEVVPHLDIVQPNPSIDSALSLIDNMLKSAAIDRGLTPDSVSIDSTAQSGAAKEIDNYELMELRADDIEALRFFEKKLFEVTRAVFNSEGSGKIPEAAVFGVDFDPIMMPVSEKEAFEVKEKKWEFGLWTPVDDMIDEDEGIDEAEALKIILHNFEIRKQINERKAEASPINNGAAGGFGQGGPRSSGDNPPEGRDENLAASDS